MWYFDINSPEGIFGIQSVCISKQTRPTCDPGHRIVIARRDKYLQHERKLCDLTDNGSVVDERAEQLPHSLRRVAVAQRDALVGAKQLRALASRRAVQPQTL
jgi:hypothetical protein